MVNASRNSTNDINMTSASMQNIRLALATLSLLLVFVAVTKADDEASPAKPKTDGRPVFLAAGRVVVLPEGVDESPKDYKGAIGARPFALVKIDGEIVGEIYAAPLQGTPADEAKGMAASADGEKIKLLKSATFKHDGKEVEVVTLQFHLPSKLGEPWVLHSLYFPVGKSSSTFKLAVSEAKFETIVPYFETMMFFDKEKSPSE